MNSSDNAFISVLNRLKVGSNEFLIESIINGYSVIFENETEVETDKYILESKNRSHFLWIKEPLKMKHEFLSHFGDLEPDEDIFYSGVFMNPRGDIYVLVNPDIHLDHNGVRFDTSTKIKLDDIDTKFKIFITHNGNYISKLKQYVEANTKDED